MNTSEQKASAMRDQAWASVAGDAERIRRIIDEGPQDDYDFKLIKKCLLLVAGDLALRRAGTIQ